MPRPEKVQAVADIKERIENARAVFLAEYAGLSVGQQQTLRRDLKANGAEFKVVKMTLARLAAAELEIDTLDEHLLGPTGLAIADGDVVAAAKVLKDFAKANEVFRLKGGLLGLEYLSPERVSELADIEPRDVLLARVAGLFAAPMGNVAGLLQAAQQDMVGLMQALADKRQAGGETLPAAASEPDTAEPEAVADEPLPEEAQAIEVEATTADDSDSAPDDGTEGSEEEPAAAVVAEAPEASAEEADSDSADEAEEPPVAVDAASDETQDTVEEDQAEEAEEE